MNKFSRVFVIYILVLATTGSDEIKSKYKSSTRTTILWKEPSTTKEKETTISTSWKPSSTSTSLKPSSTSTSLKPSSTSTTWKQPTTTIKPLSTSWQKSSTTSKWTEPTTTAKSTRISSSAAINNGVVAVASFSGIDSRNGRLSPINSIKVFPSDSAFKTDEKGNFIFKSVNGKMPITITKEGDGVSGTIRILPGSVSVSSSASSSPKSGPATAVASYSPWSSSYMKPVINDIYFPPFPTFPRIPDPIYTSRIPDSSFNTRFPNPFPYMRFPEPTFRSRMDDPWFNKDSYKQPQYKQNVIQPKWYYPTFNPFMNFW